VSPNGDELITHPPPALKGGSESPSDVRRAGIPSEILPAAAQLMSQGDILSRAAFGCPLADAGKARTLDSYRLGRILPALPAGGFNHTPAGLPSGEDGGPGGQSPPVFGVKGTRPLLGLTGQSPVLNSSPLGDTFDV